MVTPEGSAEPPGEGRVILRRFTASDLEQITRIEDASFPVDAFPESEFRRLHAEYPHEFLVAEISGRVVGYVAGSVMGDCGEIESIAVDQEFRGRGLGFMLAKGLVDRFQQIGLRTCRLEVRTANAAAIRLYERLGFHVVGASPSYYADGGDALSMEKTLGGKPPTGQSPKAETPYLGRGRR